MPLAEVFSPSTIRLNRQQDTFLRDAGCARPPPHLPGIFRRHQAGFGSQHLQIARRNVATGQAHKVRYQGAEASLSAHVNIGRKRMRPKGEASLSAYVSYGQAHEARHQEAVASLSAHVS
jgi:hypothetical protein